MRRRRLRRGVTQTALADLACISPAFVSIVEAGQRERARVRDIVALAGVLNVSPLFVADSREDTSVPRQRPTQIVPFPARTDPRTLARHQQEARMTGVADLARLCEHLSRKAVTASW